jgi:hypothetical protein
MGQITHADVAELADALDSDSVSQFFQTVWADREFGGGNKNKHLVLSE